jgi:hypothetical protein
MLPRPWQAAWRCSQKLEPQVKFSMEGPLNCMLPGPLCPQDWALQISTALKLVITKKNYFSLRGK